MTALIQTFSIKFVLDQLNTIAELRSPYENFKEGSEQLLVNGGILNNFYWGLICRKGTAITQSKRSATIGWRVAYKENFAKNASQIAGNGTLHALKVVSEYFILRPHVLEIYN